MEEDESSMEYESDDESEYSSISSESIVDEFESRTNSSDYNMSTDDDEGMSMPEEDAEEELLPYNPANASGVFTYFDGLTMCSLSKAIIANDVNKVQALLKTGKQLDKRDNQGYTPLHIAVSVNNMDILELFLKQPNIKLNATNHMNETPLFLSLKMERSEDFILKLIQAGCDINIGNSEKETPLHMAAQNGYLQVGKALIKQGANINAQDYAGFTPLHTAIYESKLEFVQMLLYYGADATIKCDHNLTPFMRAVTNAKENKIALELLEYETNLDNVTSDGYTTLLLTLNNFNPIAMELIKRGANVDCTTPDHKTSLQLALFWEDAEPFKTIWQKINKSLLAMPTVSPFLHVYINDCNFKSEDWMECLLSLLDSEISKELVSNYVAFKLDIFPSLVKAFTAKKLSESCRTRVIKEFLSFKVPVEATDVSIMYNNYGFRGEIETLLTSNIVFRDYVDVVVIPRLIIFMEGKVNAVIIKFLREIFDLEYYLKEVLRILTFITPDQHFKRIYRKRIRKIEKNGQMRDRTCKKVHSIILSEFEKRDEVPSLLELSRNASRTFIRNNCNISGSLSRHSFLKDLILSQHIKDIIRFKKPLYTINYFTNARD